MRMMTGEESYHKAVLGWLEDSFVEIDYEPRLDSGRRPDFIAYTPFDSYVIEVEDTFRSVSSGVGQAVIYSLETGHTPVLIFPADEVEEPEYSNLRNSDMVLIETV